MKKAILLTALFLFLIRLSAQYPLILNKQGNFQVINWDVYRYSECGFTKAEQTSHYQKLLSIINAIKTKNPILNELKGFDAVARIFAEHCDPKFGYGIPAMINFEFAAWFMDKGKEMAMTSEPPSWKIYINRPRQINGFQYTTYSSSSEVKTGFNKNAWEAAGKKLQELFYTTGEKETLVPGLDRYNKQDIVIYNPDRPAYWLPVTVREVYSLLFDYWKLDPDKAQSETIVKLLENEYELFTEEEKDGYAYGFGKGVMAKIGTNTSSPQVMRVNPAYWNRNLPKSAIQFITFTISENKKYLESTAAEYLKKNSISYHEAKFEAVFDVYSLVSVIDK